MKTKVVIIGTGNIGRRHMQALNNIHEKVEIIGYDISSSCLDAAKTFCVENSFKVKFDTADSIEKALGSIDKDSIVIIATIAKGRVDILKKVIEKHPLAVIAEKPLCQSEKEYNEALEYSKKNNVPVYINFSRHTMSFYKKIAHEMKGMKEKTFSCIFPDGMACIGIHILDLMTFILGAETFKMLSSSSGGICDTKRPGCHDFYGDMSLEINGSHKVYLKAAQEKCIFSVRISSEEKEYTVYEFAKKLIICGADNNIEVQDIEVPYISQISDKVVSDLIDKKGKCDLPPIEDARLAHMILFRYMDDNGLGSANIT